MKKTYFGIATLLLLVSLIGGAYASTTERFELMPVGASSSHATASYTLRMNDDTSSMDVNFRATDVPQIGGKIYEVWLVDTESGYMLSLGTFQPTNAGKISFKAKQKMVNPAVYDMVVVTEEYLNDIDPTSSGVVIMEGTIPNSIASVVMMSATLKGRNEVPAVHSTARGTGMFMVDTAANMVFYNLSYEGFDSNETGAHIHGFVPAGENAPVLHELPLGVMKIGNWSYSESDEAQLLAGLTYTNVHSAEFPNGEIRGQILFTL